MMTRRSLLKRACGAACAVVVSMYVPAFVRVTDDPIELLFQGGGFYVPVEYVDGIMAALESGSVLRGSIGKDEGGITASWVAPPANRADTPSTRAEVNAFRPQRSLVLTPVGGWWPNGAAP